MGIEVPRGPNAVEIFDPIELIRIETQGMLARIEALEKQVAALVEKISAKEES